MSDVRKQMEELREAVYENLQQFVQRQQIAQYFVEIYMGDVFAAELSNDADVQRAVHTYVEQLFGEYLVFTPDVATLFDTYAQAGLILFDEYEGNYIHMPTVKAAQMIEKLEQLPAVDLEMRALQAVTAFESFTKEQQVIDVKNLAEQVKKDTYAYLYLTLLYLEATTQATLQQMIYLQHYTQHIEVLYFTQEAQDAILSYLSEQGYLVVEEQALEMTEKTAALFGKIEQIIDAEQILLFDQQVALFQK
ncbi:MAG: hypothetical protein ACRDAO_04715 [Culicoidibacterales bacterium]